MRIADITPLMSFAAKRMNAAQEIRRAISDAPHKGDIRLTAIQAACLLAALTPKVKAKKGLFDFGWVFKATNAKDPRPFCRYAYSDGERLIATDGNRLHVLRGTDLPIGFYNSRGEPVEMGELKFPPIDRVIPSLSEMCVYAVTPEYLLEHTVDLGGPTKHRWAYDLPSGHLVMKTYFDEAMNGRTAMVFSASSDIHSSILIEGEKTTAVIMPVRV